MRAGPQQEDRGQAHQEVVRGALGPFCEVHIERDRVSCGDVDGGRVGDDRGEQELWFYDPKKFETQGDEVYHEAYRPNLPLRHKDGTEADDEAAWVEKNAAENKGYWRRPLSSSASGKGNMNESCDSTRSERSVNLPSYRIMNCHIVMCLL